MVPLRLVRGKILNDDAEVIWFNEGYSSPLFCRPISLEFAKETSEITRQREAEITSEINNLIEFKSSQNDKTISINHKMILSMVNGKVCIIFD